MEYLRAIISSPERGPLYKKDFEARKVFDIFVRLQVNKLIEAGELIEREYYSAVIIPGYGVYTHEKRKEEVDASQREFARAWLSLQIREPAKTAPMDFFTLELHLGERPYILSETFRLSEIDYFWLNLEQALMQLDFMDYQEHREHLLFAYKDDEFDFDREELYAWQKEADELIEIVVKEGEPADTTPHFAQREFNDFTILKAQKILRGKLVKQGVKEFERPSDPRASALHILITNPTLESLQEAACLHIEAEIGGSLVGEVFQHKEMPGYIVEISGYLPAQNTLANEVELRTTFETWQQQSLLLKERYPGKRLVGWYHTHLDLVSRPRIDRTRESLAISFSPLFFSQADEFTQRQFFREKWYVAMVLDTRGNLVFYRWAGHKIVEAAKFYVTAAEGHREG